MRRAYLQDLPAAPPGDWTGLAGGALALALARSLADRPLLVVTPDEDAADGLAAELRFYLGARRVSLLAADDARPYDGLSPHPARVQDRIAALDALRRGARAVVVAPAAALIQRVLPPEVLASAPRLRAGDEVEPRALVGRLGDLGYLATPRVEEAGTFSRRGEVLDVWPTGAELPARIELFDEEIEAIRALDPRTRRPGDALSSLRLLPASELALGDQVTARAGRWMTDQVRQRGHGHRQRKEILEDLEAGLRSSGLEVMLPALHPVVEPLSYLGGGRLFVQDRAACAGAVVKARELAEARYAALGEAERPLATPEARYVDADALLAALARGTAVESLYIEGGVAAAGEASGADFGARDNGDLRIRGGELAGPAGVIGGWLAEGWRVGLVAESRERADRAAALLRHHGLEAEPERGRDPLSWAPGTLRLLRGDLPRGFRAPEESLAVIAAAELFGEKVHVRQPTRTVRQAIQEAGLTHFAQLKDGDLVIHRVHGVGRYRGLRRVDLGQGPQDMLQLEYRGGDRLYLPAHRLDLLNPYPSGDRKVQLDRMGGESWEKRKARVKSSVLALAAELIRTEARRRARPGWACPSPTARYREFEDRFPYTETPDQAAAIAAVNEDLSRARPMDRLVVGDVGFGKTEVALRAMMRAVEGGRQAVLLCPTTVLAIQHAQTVRARFEPFGIEVELLSRFSTPKEARAVKAGLSDGSIQIAVGTTSLLGRGVQIPNLGLVVVDEEHRFGVQQKERLKRLKEEIDYLAMSATPIPRTLHMAVTGIRDFSVIATPPRDRRPIYTALARFSEGRIREDVMRELRRGGKVFFVHNRIASIQNVARQVSEWVPEARLGVAHGQMEDRELEQVMVRFIRGELNVLICTAIVESGLDLPDVNTILINQADQFGLAQLYQLRGRVGRSHLRAWCTLMVDEGKELTREGRERLRVLQEHTDLGAGFAVASADLDQRGAGDLLGRSQHGHIQAVGFETWAEILEAAIQEAKGGAALDQLDPEIELRQPALLPEDYVPEMEDRLVLYRRFAMARSLPDVRGILEELEWERGEPPPEALNLSRLMELKIRCRGLGVARMQKLKSSLALVFSPHAPLTEAQIAATVAAAPRRFKRRGSELQVRFTPQEGERPFLFAHWALGQLEKARGEGRG